MTSAQMIQAFKVGYDIVNLEGPGYEDTEIYVLLNQAQSIEVLKMVKTRQWTNISNIIVNENRTLSAGPLYQYTATFTPALDYIGYINSKTKITRTNFKVISSASWVDNIPIISELSGKYITNPNNRPILLNPRVYEESTQTLVVIYDSLTTLGSGKNFYLDYVRKPNDIGAGTDCEVNDILHDQIVNTAVTLAKKVFNPIESGNSAQTDMLLNKPE